jgi:hypothetical protein
LPDFQCGWNEGRRGEGSGFTWEFGTDSR